MKGRENVQKPNLVTPNSPKCPLLGKIVSGRITGQANIIIPDCMKQGCALWHEGSPICGDGNGHCGFTNSRAQEMFLLLAIQKIAQAIESLSRYQKGTSE